MKIEQQDLESLSKEELIEWIKVFLNELSRKYDRLKYNIGIDTGETGNKPDYTEINLLKGK